MKGLYNETDLSLDHIQSVLNAKPAHVYLLGNMGDPIYHSDFPKIIKMMGDYNQPFTVYTMGSGFSKTWWQEVYESYTDLAGNSKWVFSVDGVQGSAGVYRQGLNFEQSFSAMKLGAELKKKISWQYIVFSHNQEYINKAKSLATQFDIELKVDFNIKWDNEDDPWKPTKSKKELGL